MPKQGIPLNFSQGLDTKTDPFQVPVGKFLDLQNSVFTKGGMLTKRNGYRRLTSPDNDADYLTTFNGALTAIGTSLESYSSSANKWKSPGAAFQAMSLDVTPIVRNSVNQSHADSAIASNGLVCTVYTESDGTTTSHKYVVADSATGQNVVAPTAITNADATLGAPRVFLLGAYFIIVYTRLITATYHLEYIALSTSSGLAVGSTTNIASYTPSSTVAWDGVVYSNRLYFAWNGAAASGINCSYLSSTLTLSASVIRDAGHVATLVSVTADTAAGQVWITYLDSGTGNGYATVLDTGLAVVLAPTAVIAGGALNLATVAASGTLNLFYEVSNNYSYDAAIPSHYIKKLTCTSAGVVSSTTTAIRSVGLASKAFYMNATIYFLCVYQSPYQSTYFLSDSSGNIVAKLAYSNAYGYYVTGLPSVVVSDDTARVPYLLKTLIQAVNKGTNQTSTAGNPVSAGTGVYAQVGVNLASFTFGGVPIASEIGTNLNLSGGITWAYDGYSVTEQGFHLYPDSVEKTATANAGGAMIPQQYYWVATYEWQDNQGNLFRSAPSIPITFTVPGGTNANTVTLAIPTLRLTYKTANPVKIVVYRWSTAQQVYYQTTTITAPVMNSTSTDSVSFTDTHSDAQIIGNNILYTTGGVVENIGAPSFKSTFLFDDRLWGIPSEDQNLLWFSKQVIEATPVEMSDLFTMFVAPNTGAQGPSGKLTCGFPMDDKGILFKDTSILYFNGRGPDNTGSQNQYSSPVLVTSTVGCSNQNSIVFMPTGLMFEFQSESGNQIWLLGRDLSTRYIGADVEGFTTNATVLSAVNIPGTNQVRFTMSSGITLVYDYFFNQWGTFVNVPAISSTVFQGLHTYINAYAQVFQENPGSYLDGSSPVLLSFVTGWLNVAGLRGYERIHEFGFLGVYYSPHKLAIQVGYDYGSPEHQSIYVPPNYGAAYGGDTLYGGSSTYGGPSNIENFRVFAKRQKCKAFQVRVQELYDSSIGASPGQGLSLSGLNLVVSLKKAWSPVAARNSVG